MKQKKKGNEHVPSSNPHSHLPWLMDERQQDDDVGSASREQTKLLKTSFFAVALAQPTTPINSTARKVLVQHKQTMLAVLD